MGGASTARGGQRPEPNRCLGAKTVRPMLLTHALLEGVRDRLAALDGGRFDVGQTSGVCA